MYYVSVHALSKLLAGRNSVGQWTWHIVFQIAQEISSDLQSVQLGMARNVISHAHLMPPVWLANVFLAIT